MINKKFIFFLFLIFFCGCKKKIDNNIVFINNFQEAKFVDLPVPLNAYILNDKITDETYGFHTSLDLDKLIKFYDDEMSNLGWKKIVQFNNFETLLFFEKPNKYSSISIRKVEKKPNELFVLIFIVNKS